MRDKLTAAFCEKTNKPGLHSDGGGLYLEVKRTVENTGITGGVTAFQNIPMASLKALAGYGKKAWGRMA